MIYKSYLVEKNINLIKTNVNLIYGENTGLIGDFKEIIKKNNKEVACSNFSQEEIIKNTDNFTNELFNFSLFDKEKFFFIEEVTDKFLEIIKQVTPKLESQKIFLFSKILDKKSKLRSHFEKSKELGAIPCYSDNHISLRKIVMEKLEGYKGLTLENVNIIIEKSNSDRGALNNEINKIKIYFNDKTLITSKLETLLNLENNKDFNLLRDEAICGNKIRTNSLMSKTILDPEKNFFYISMINQRLNKIAESIKLSKLGTTIDQAVEMLKPPVFWKDKPTFIEQSKKWNLDKIKQILIKTYELEIRMKSNSSINKNILLKKLIIDICALANA